MATQNFDEVVSLVIDNHNLLADLIIAIECDIFEIQQILVRVEQCIIAMHYIPLRVPMHTSALTGKKWVDELLNGHPVHCFNALRMNKDTFLMLCHTLEYKYMIDTEANTSVKECVAWFLRTLSHRCANRDSMERFQHSGSTISKHFGDILEAIGRLGKDIVRPRENQYRETPPKISNSNKYYPTFKDCIGALDGCHIELTVPEKDRIRFINRKGVTSTNVLVVCDFDLLFVFVCAGWEGSAHDTRVYLHSINDETLRFPQPPQGKYYLGDKGYPDRDGLMTPHTRVPYHQSEFRAENPVGSKEKFNKLHSSLRSAIERSFGVLKARWQILRKIPSFPLLKQVKIVNACFVLHNYTRLSSYGDPCFSLIDAAPNFIPLSDELDSCDTQPNPRGVVDNGSHEMIQLKDRLTQELVSRRR